MQYQAVSGCVNFFGGEGERSRAQIGYPSQLKKRNFIKRLRSRRQLAATAAHGSFWQRSGKAKVHVPLAADIVAASADLLFGNTPRCKVYDERRDNVEDGRISS